jgi:hypothetical protein
VDGTVTTAIIMVMDVAGGGVEETYCDRSCAA